MDDPLAHVAAAVGERRLREVCAAFYRRVPGDPLLGPMYPADDLAGAEERLADFLVQRFGGGPVYSAKRGHPRLRMRHAAFAIDARARDRWIALMDAAIAEVGLPAEIEPLVRGFLGEVATFLINRR